MTSLVMNYLLTAAQLGPLGADSLTRGEGGINSTSNRETRALPNNWRPNKFKSEHLNAIIEVCCCHLKAH